MNSIKLITYGKSLGTRAQAEKLRNSILDNSIVEFDFKEISIISNSFADELFGIYVQKNGIEKLLKNVRIKNTNAEVAATIKQAIYSRI